MAPIRWLKPIATAVERLRGRSSVVIDFGELSDRLDEIDIHDESELRGAFSSGLDFIADKAANQALGTMANPGKFLREHRAFQQGFERRLRKAWQEALDLFDLTRLLSLEFGTDVHRRCGQAAADEQDFVLEALTRLHG